MPLALLQTALPPLSVAKHEPPSPGTERRSSLDLTMNVYTDLSLLDVAGALEALPKLSPKGAVESPLTTQPQAVGRLTMGGERA